MSSVCRALYLPSSESIFRRRNFFFCMSFFSLSITIYGKFGFKKGVPFNTFYKDYTGLNCMKSKPESLEMMLEKPNWKQWLPIYGVYQIKKDFFRGKPTIIDKGKGLSYNGSALYQAISIVGAYIGAINFLSELGVINL